MFVKLPSLTIQKYAWENSKDYRADNTLEEERAQTEIKELETEIELRYVKIYIVVNRLGCIKLETWFSGVLSSIF